MIMAYFLGYDSRPAAEQKYAFRRAIKSRYEGDGETKGDHKPSHTAREPVPDQQYWDTASAEERINAAWELTCCA
jgi:hypothetical protein